MNQASCVTTWSLSHEVGHISLSAMVDNNSKHSANCKVPTMRRMKSLVTTEGTGIRPQKELPHSCALEVNGSAGCGGTSL